MKTYEEKAESVRIRLAQEEKKRAERRKTAGKIAFSLAGAVAVAVICVGIAGRRIPKTTVNGAGESLTDTDGALQLSGEAQAGNFGKKMTEDEAYQSAFTEEGCPVLRNDKVLTPRLAQALAERDKSTPLTVTAMPVVDYDFIIGGKTLGDYHTAMTEERNLPDKLGQLLKEGDALRFGEALTVTGTPEGEIWPKDFYESRIAFYGEDILAKYIQNGDFLREKCAEDWEKSQSAHAAADAFDRAMDTFLAYVVTTLPDALSPQPVKTVNGVGRISLTLTPAEFETLAIDTLNGGLYDLAEAGASGDDAVD